MWDVESVSKLLLIYTCIGAWEKQLVEKTTSAVLYKKILYIFCYLFEMCCLLICKEEIDYIGMKLLLSSYGLFFNIAAQ